MTRRILSPADLGAWKASSAYEKIVNLILRVNQAVRGVRISESGPGRERVRALSMVLEHLDVLVSQTPPVAMEGSRRYGNKAFRTLIERALDIIPGLMEEAGLPAELGLLYLVPSLGNPTRLDYGTGHELSFIALLACVEEEALLTETPMVEGVRPQQSAVAEEYIAMGLSIFDQYLRLAQRVQATYSLEPAGSHGVWGLDDYQFMPFLWGSSQLAGQVEISPGQILEPGVLEGAEPDYLYAKAIGHIFSLKKGRSFGEHSPLLYDLTALPDWGRINKGMIRMYQEEVLHKFPVVQHFEFSRWLPMEKEATITEAEREKIDMSG